MLNKITSKIKKTNFNHKKYSEAFSIVELIIVIIVIGILAGIITTSYSSVLKRVAVEAQKNDLINAATALKSFKSTKGYYPTTISTDCIANPTSITNLCLEINEDNDFTSIPYSRPTTNTFVLTAVNSGIVYHITDSSLPTEGEYVDPALWIAIGTQVWAKYNLNVGTRRDGADEQTNDGIVEKYCYNNLEANCTTYGGLYQWNEAMAYSTTESAQGICPAGSHIPSDAEWKTLEMFLGMTQPQADAAGARGTNQGTQLKPGGSSGMNVPLAGYRNVDGFFYNLSSSASLWSSSESGGYVWKRDLGSGNATVFRNTSDKALGISVRCIGN